MRIFRLMLSLLCLALLWGYFAGSNNYHDGLKESKEIFAAGMEKGKRFVYLSEVVKASMGSKNGAYIPLAQIPLTLQHAIIATEDARFYRHHGIDLEGIARALFINLQDRQYSEGGSTITQQLLKNLFLSKEKTLSRKSEEIILAIDLEFHFTKEEILEMYLNSIYYGSGAYGIAAAADIYFGKRVKDLTLAESALLAGLPQAPSAYSPYTNFSAAKHRQAAVLDLMVKQGFISPGAAAAAKREPIYLAR